MSDDWRKRGLKGPQTTKPKSARKHNRTPKYLNDRDDRPRVVLSAKAIDPSHAMPWTGETVGHSAHKMGPTTWARLSKNQRQVSTLTDHVAIDGRGIPKGGPVTVTQMSQSQRDKIRNAPHHDPARPNAPKTLDKFWTDLQRTS